MPNQAPIFTRVADIQGGVVLQAAAADYTGASNNNLCVFVADQTNGGFVQRLRFKANGTNIATVARIYLNNGNSQFAAVCATPGTPTIANTSGGTLPAATYSARVQAIDPVGGVTAFGTNATPVTVIGGAANVSWSSVANAALYRVAVGVVGGQEFTVFTTNALFYLVTSLDHTVNTSINDYGMNQLSVNQFLFGEVSLPATTGSTTAATAEIEYPMNVALPPGWRILVGLGTAVGNSWICSAIGGKY